MMGDPPVQADPTPSPYSAHSGVQEVCLHPVVAMTHDSTLLLSALRQLSGSQALALAQYLLKLMAKYSGDY